jgi:hypothetical protein
VQIDGRRLQTCDSRLKICATALAASAISGLHNTPITPACEKLVAKAGCKSEARGHSCLTFLSDIPVRSLVRKP